MYLDLGMEDIFFIVYMLLCIMLISVYIFEGVNYPWKVKPLKKTVSKAKKREFSIDTPFEE